MRKTFLAMIALSTAGPAAAADWRFVAGTGFVRGYVDWTSIRRDGAVATAWTYIIYATPMARSDGSTPDSLRTLRKVNCVESTSQTLQAQYFRGRSIDSEEGAGAMHSVEPVSTEGMVIASICAGSNAGTSVADPYADAKQGFANAPEDEGWDF